MSSNPVGRPPVALASNRLPLPDYRASYARLKDIRDLPLDLMLKTGSGAMGMFPAEADRGHAIHVVPGAAQGLWWAAFESGRDCWFALPSLITSEFLDRLVTAWGGLDYDVRWFVPGVEERSPTFPTTWRQSTWYSQSSRRFFVFANRGSDIQVLRRAGFHSLKGFHGLYGVAPTRLSELAPFIEAGIDVDDDLIVQKDPKVYEALARSASMYFERTILLGGSKPFHPGFGILGLGIDTHSAAFVP